MSELTGRSIDRRAFLGAAAGVASLAALRPFLGGVAFAGGTCTGKVKDSQIGIQLFTCTSMYLANTPLLLENLAAIGYQKVEHALGWGTTGGPDGFRKACDDAGITATSGHYGDGLHPYDADTWKQTLENANIVGQTYVGVASKPSGDNSKAAWMAYVEDINKAAPLAKAAGFKSVFHHCHDGEWKPVDDDEKVRPVDIMLKGTNPDEFHVQLDIGWAYNGLGSIEAVCKELHHYKGRFGTVHVKDFRAGAPVQPGTGEIGEAGFAQIFAAAKESRQNITEYHVENDSSILTCYDTAQTGWDLLHDMEYEYKCR